MKVTLSFGLEVSSIQAATSLRDRGAEWLGQQGVQVTSSQLAEQTLEFKVVGVDTVNKRPFKERVSAVGPDEAEALCVGGSKSKVVADVQRWI